MLQSGMGVSHMTTFLAALEIPGLHHNSVRERQREVAKAVKRVAESSCLEALQEELAITSQQR